MKKILIAGKFENREISVDVPLEELTRIIMEPNIVIIKNVFGEEDIRNFRSMVLEWSKSTSPEIHGVPLQEISTEKNSHRIDDEPDKSVTPHIYHTFNLNNIKDLNEPLSSTAKKYLEALRRFQNKITNNDAEFSPTSKSVKLRPQIIQYPSGGGFIIKHVHSLFPQKIGLIVSLSKIGVDYSKGGTRFEFNRDVIDLEKDHDIGEIALFRYNLLHAVQYIDPSEKINWNSEKGRWTLVMPYY